MATRKQGQTPRLVERIRYAFDNVMSRGLVALIGLLALASIAFIALMALVVVSLGLNPVNIPAEFPEIFWASLLRTLDPGTMGQDQGKGFRLAMLLVTIGGLIIVASLISIISNAFNDKVVQLRRGRSKVLEKDHTVILGWSTKVSAVIKELSIANESRKRPSIVVMADLDKVEMEEKIHQMVKNLHNTRVIVRSGDPMNTRDLALTNHQQARSIILLSPDDDEDADNFTIKTTLALVNGPNALNSETKIIGEIRERANLEIAELLGKNSCSWVLADDLVSRLLVQTCRQSGLSDVFVELLDFEGSELYIADHKNLVGLTYGEALLRFQSSALIGVLRSGEVLLNPNTHAEILKDDRFILIAEDETKLETTDKNNFDVAVIAKQNPRVSAVEKTLILGRSDSLGMILEELDAASAKGSSATVVTESGELPESTYKNISVTLINASTTKKKSLESLGLENYQHVMVLADRELDSIQHADAKTLLTLLHLREMVKALKLRVNIVSEMLDDHNRELAEATDTDDFIVSTKLVSLLISQLSENPELAAVFTSILEAAGSQIRLRPATDYVLTEQTLDFNTLVAAATLRNETAIGYRLNSVVATANSTKVVVNPDRNAPIVLGERDQIIVLTRD